MTHLHLCAVAAIDLLRTMKPQREDLTSQLTSLHPGSEAAEGSTQEFRAQARAVRARDRSPA